MKIEKIDGLDFLITVSSSGELKIWDCLEGLLNSVDSIDSMEGFEDLENVIKPVY